MFGGSPTRSTIIRLSFAATLVVALFASAPAPSRACSCGGSYRAYPVEFVGRVLFVVESRPLIRHITGKRTVLTGSTIALLLVQHERRGPGQPVYAVFGGHDADCYVQFIPGRSFDVRGEQADLGVIATTICDGSGELSALTAS